MAQNKKFDSIPPQLKAMFKVLFDVNVVEPTKLFDNMAYVGYKGVGAFVINTWNGIVIIDSIWAYNDAKDVIVPGIKKLGWDPEEIKYILLTHGHLDHYGSARYFEDKYDAKIFISKVDWDYMMDPDAPVLRDPFGNFSDKCPKPTKYSELMDKQKITLGDTAITVISTPGHTPGGVSFIIPVKDHGVPHVVAVWGGTGLPMTLVENENYLNSLNYFESATDAAGVDAEASIHPFVNHLLEKIYTLQNRKPGDPNPIVIGKAGVKQYFDQELRRNVTSRIAELKKGK